MATTKIAVDGFANYKTIRDQQRARRPKPFTPVKIKVDRNFVGFVLFSEKVKTKKKRGENKTDAEIVEIQRQRYGFD